MDQIKPGENLPQVTLFENSPDNPVATCQICSGKKIIIFGVPGAFTPGCSQVHLPGYIERSEEIRRCQKVDDIICISWNDAYVMNAWGEQYCAVGKVRLLADPAGDFTKSVGMHMDMPHLGGLRSKRYSMIVENCKVTEVNVEPDGTGLSCSLAQNVGK